VTGGVIFVGVPFIDFNCIREDAVRRRIISSIMFECARIETLYKLTEQNYDINFLLTDTKVQAKHIFTGTLHKPIPTRSNVSMKFDIVLEPMSYLTREDIRAWMVEYFDSLDFIGGDVFHVSNLIQAIKDKFTDIDEIEFKGLNGLTPNKYQRIFMQISKGDITVENPCIAVYIDKKGNIRHDIEINLL